MSGGPTHEEIRARHLVLPGRTEPLTPAYARSKEVQHAWYVRNAEKKKAASRKRYLENREKIIAQAKAYRERRPGYGVASHRKRIYGISPEDLVRMMISQGGLCGICSTPLDCSTKKRVPQVDHEHVTGRVRGVLCLTCNLDLGRVERHGWLPLAMKYLTKP